ncbi:hypothetical protein MY04_5150 [Flammeovirga sp. MY04]|uniref:hypothetical protein n=1 Tax=Flammeovirga sp. MY04 TaxID=1191459 RepID=UPI000806435E|nr:hypothetical protein [Flammeovirga sp. MY04]ANQ52482.1 hypothetical protein MY04_5150 [Flammeovirga sp. MY04]
MENNKKHDLTTIKFTATCFDTLMKEVMFQFQEKHSQALPKKVAQIFGFGNYDPDKPNLKQDFEKQSSDFVNGKYLYDKKRLLEKGSLQIKITHYYSQLMLNYVGYQDIYSFLDADILEESDKQKQLDWLSNNDTTENGYYLSYHFGENKEVIKGQVEIYNNWKNVNYKYIYHQDDGSYKEFNYQGFISRRADILHIKTKTLMDNKLVDSGEDILYAGHMDPNSNPYLIGTYTAFDIYNRVIAGKLIFEKYHSKEEMIKASLERRAPSYIIQEIRNQVIMNRGKVPNSAFEISSRSPFVSTYDKLAGVYQIVFDYAEDENASLGFSIDPTTFKIKSTTDGCIFQKDEFEIIQNGSVVHFSFQLMGLSKMMNVEIFFKSFFLNENSSPYDGIFSGMDHEGKLIHGKVKISKS